ncbi:hypothetical protein M422DRAFT_249583 [Sphaerobolus stellatus SS14]|uniref:Uncharacterized protein n=1 Tax=Sphaerobolus stellatus (strain SS14) TaxID=990650 RepID=A0A0C9W530_SPHS4|nr:hypothetical protein M422DRAFT_249583 [Sphaerobolus stellatus SS14]
MVKLLRKLVSILTINASGHVPTNVRLRWRSTAAPLSTAQRWHHDGVSRNATQLTMIVVTTTTATANVSLPCSPPQSRRVTSSQDVYSSWTLWNGGGACPTTLPTWTPSSTSFSMVEQTKTRRQGPLVYPTTVFTYGFVPLLLMEEVTITHITRTVLNPQDPPLLQFDDHRYPFMNLGPLMSHADPDDRQGKGLHFQNQRLVQSVNIHGPSGTQTRFKKSWQHPFHLVRLSSQPWWLSIAALHYINTPDLGAHTMDEYHDSIKSDNEDDLSHDIAASKKFVSVWWKHTTEAVACNGGWDTDLCNDHQLGPYIWEHSHSPSEEWHPTWMRCGLPDYHKPPPGTAKFSSNDWSLMDFFIHLPDPVHNIF